MKLSPVERAILSCLLNEGDNVPANIADETDFHSKSISRSLANLEDRGHVENKGRGVYRLTTSGLDLAELVHEFDDRNTSE